MSQKEHKENKQTEKLIQEQKSIHQAESHLTKRIVRWILVSVLLFFVLVVIIGGYTIYSALGPVDRSNNQTVEVTIPVGSSSSGIARILEEAGIINRADIFSYYLKLNNNEELQAGHYQFQPSMNAEQVLSQLQAGGKPIQEDADTTLTVIEGMTVEEIAKLVEENTVLTAEEFIQTAEDSEFLQDLVKRYPSLLSGLLEREGVRHQLEGYLFPATYDYFAGMTVKELIEAMIAASNLVYQDLLDQAGNTYLNYNQVLALASIIEREAVTEEDRKLVSGVFYNRLDQNMPLQSDITILYALREHKEFVTYSDLEIDSPYNTYQNTGLPPGPINNPSRMSIEAAINPTWNDYYYFVANLDTGEVFYSSTIEEHNQLVEEHVNSRQRSIEAEQESVNYQEETTNQPANE